MHSVCGEPMVRLIVDYSGCISVEKLELVLFRVHQIDMASPAAVPETALVVRNAAGSDANTTPTTPATPATKDTSTTPALTVSKTKAVKTVPKLT